MITRRCLLAAPPGALLLSQTAALAQPVEPPTPDEVTEVVKNHGKYRAMLIATEALRLVLILRLIELSTTSTVPDEGDAEWARIREPFLTERVQKAFFANYSNNIIIDAGATVAPTSANILSALAEGGLDGVLAKDMVRGFYVFVQIYAVAERQVPVPSAAQSWYCTTYPFIWFCKHS